MSEIYDVIRKKGNGKNISKHVSILNQPNLKDTKLQCSKYQVFIQEKREGN